jgi:hypothetical protein
MYACIFKQPKNTLKYENLWCHGFHMCWDILGYPSMRRVILGFLRISWDISGYPFSSRWSALQMHRAVTCVESQVQWKWHRHWLIPDDCNLNVARQLSSYSVVTELFFIISAANHSHGTHNCILRVSPSLRAGSLRR